MFPEQKNKGSTVHVGLILINIYSRTFFICPVIFHPLWVYYLIDIRGVKYEE